MKNSRIKLGVGGLCLNRITIHDLRFFFLTNKLNG
jgi:hypothetical protein